MSENRFKLARTLYNKNGKQSVKTVSDETGITRSLIDDLETSVGKPRGVGYMFVAQLAKHYGVSSDYLLGLSDVPTTDMELRAVCEYTGLSQAAALSLHELFAEKINDCYAAGFTDSDYCPKDLLSELIEYGDNSIFISFVEFCDGINGKRKIRKDVPRAVLSIALKAEQDRYRGKGITALSEEELVDLRISHAIREIGNVLDLIAWGKDEEAQRHNVDDGEDE